MKKREYKEQRKKEKQQEKKRKKNTEISFSSIALKILKAKNEENRFSYCALPLITPASKFKIAKISSRDKILRCKKEVCSTVKATYWIPRKCTSTTINGKRGEYNNGLTASE
uniref:Uncharacterized protein n=1 Tax=Romanomermis culicivorax TaxID=13658 RepID=A0A915I6L3_ROMCU